MQITEQTKENIIKASKKIKHAKPDILYFADSLGAMLPKDISKYISYLKVHWAVNLEFIRTTILEMQSTIVLKQWN